MNIRAKIFGGAGAGEEPLLKPKRPKGAKADELHSVALRGIRASAAIAAARTVIA